MKNMPVLINSSQLFKAAFSGDTTKDGPYLATVERVKTLLSAYRIGHDIMIELLKALGIDKILSVSDCENLTNARLMYALLHSEKHIQIDCYREMILNPQEAFPIFSLYELESTLDNSMSGNRFSVLKEIVGNSTIIKNYIEITELNYEELFQLLKHNYNYKTLHSTIDAYEKIVYISHK